MYGFMLLRKGLLIWQRFYFQLDDVSCTLSCSVSPTSDPHKVFVLDFCTAIPVKAGSKRFILQSAKKTFTLKAGTPEICEDWVKAISQAKVQRRPATRRSSSVNFHPEVCVRTFECDSITVRSYSADMAMIKKQIMGITDTPPMRLSTPDRKVNTPAVIKASDSVEFTKADQFTDQYSEVICACNDVGCCEIVSQLPDSNSISSESSLCSSLAFPPLEVASLSRDWQPILSDSALMERSGSIIIEEF
jgi:hypothetical protein